MSALGYLGSYTDPATGLVSMGSRWYNPATAGFTAADPRATVPGPGGGTPATVGDPLAGGGPGRNGYAADNPLTTTDPTVRLFQPVGGTGLGPIPAGALGVRVAPAVTPNAVAHAPEFSAEDLRAADLAGAGEGPYGILAWQFAYTHGSVSAGVASPPQRRSGLGQAAREPGHHPGPARQAPRSRRSSSMPKPPPAANGGTKT